MDPQALYYVFAGILIVVGVLGVVVPVLPGLPLVFLGMWLAAWADGYEQVGVAMLLLLGLLTALSLGVDLLATVFGAKRVGASRQALVGAALGTLFGLFLGLVGIFVGPFVGALAGEWLHGRRLGHATRVGMGTWLGIVFGAVLKLALAFAMLGLFLFALWW